jgi:predicted transcriptional regulator of viral defense system
MSENTRHTGGIMRIEALRKKAGQEEVDYQFLINALQDYSSPRDKVSAWLKSGDLIRVKKGLYVFGKSVAHAPYSLEVLANLVYGPSAISLSYALSYYGLIPERVSAITSITNKRRKEFLTPVGNFIYYYLHPKKYSVGIEIQSTSANRQFLIAAPEKALCDQISIADKDLPRFAN